MSYTALIIEMMRENATKQEETNSLILGKYNGLSLRRAYNAHMQLGVENILQTLVNFVSVREAYDIIN